MKRQHLTPVRSTLSAAYALVWFVMLWIVGCPDVKGAASGTVVQWMFNGSTVIIPDTVKHGVTAIAAGYGHYMALKEDGYVVVWGSNQFGLTNVPVAARSGVKAIAAGYVHSLALRNDGTVVGWGYNNYGPATPPTGLSNVIAIAAGGEHSMALKSDGSVAAWGLDRNGRTTVPGSAQSGVIAIASGFSHSVALKNDGSVLQWGITNAWSYPYDTNLFNIPLAAQSEVVAISAGFSRTVALKADGSVVSWGTGLPSTIDVPAAAQSGIIAVSTSHPIGSKPQDYTLALKDDGTVIAWGSKSNAPSTWFGNGRFRAVAAGGGSDLFLYEPELPVIQRFTYQHWPVPVGFVVSLHSSAKLDSLAPYAAAEWHLNGRPIEGVPATNLVISGQTASLNIPITNVNQSGIYTIVYRNDSGSVTSAPLAKIDVRIPWFTQISLDIARSSNGMMIAWHTNALDLVLQSTTNLTAPVNWTDWAEVPSVLGPQFVVTNHLQGQRQFFRLFRPYD